MKRNLSRAINKKTLQPLIFTFILAISTFAILSMQIQRAHASYSSVEIIPETLEYGPENATGQEFNIKAYIKNVTDLYGIDLQFEWDPTYLLYLNHTMHIPVETYPDGILHQPGITIMNTADPVAGTYSLAHACMAPAYSFNGTGIAFDMWFRIISHPVYPEPDAVLSLHWISTDLSDVDGNPLDGGWTENDGTVTIHAIPYDYPPKPMLKITPETVNVPTGTQFNSSVNLMGEDGGDLDPFWDVAGFDVYMNFRRTEAPYLTMEALDITIDPDGLFAAFWPNGIFTIDETINNTEGWVHVAFLGLPGINGTHTAPYGKFCIFTVRFNATYGDTAEVTTNITLKNPYSFVHRMNLHADDGLIELTSPVDIEWHAINAYDYGAPINLYAWIDTDGDGELSSGDEIILNNTSSGVWHRYVTNEVKGTLGPLEQQPFHAVDDYVWLASFGGSALDDCNLPGRYVGTDDPYNGFGVPYWTGNFSTYYAVSSVNEIVCHYLPFTGDEYTAVLVEGVDYIVHPDDDLIELLVPQDVAIINEHWQDGVNNSLNGWPAINYVASGIESVYRKFPAYHPYYNETEGYAANAGYSGTPPGEWWYDPDWPWELEGWWALGHFCPAEYCWNDTTEWWINYTAASYLTIDYNADPDPAPYYFELDGTYAEFLAALSDPVGTHWSEVSPSTLPEGDIVEWSDEDSSGEITIGDYFTIETDIGNRTYLVNGVATDIIVDQIMTVEDVDQRSPFYGEMIIVGVAGFPHPERALSPWRNSSSSMPLPHNVENASVVIPEFPASFTLVLSLTAATSIAVLMKPKPKKTEK